jgi:glucokinase
MKRLHFAKFRSADHHSFDEMVRLFLDNLSLDTPLQAACFGIPGPQVDGAVVATNLGWKIVTNTLPRLLGIPHVAVLNDLESTAYGLSSLHPNDLATLQMGSATTAGNQCVIAPGTGLGEAGLFWDGSQHRPWACEGGHADFAPTDELQRELLNYLENEYGRVSFERVVSGMGIGNIYRFLRDTGHGIEIPTVAEEMLEQDAASVIDRHASNGSCALCVSTMNLFVQALGAEAANMALKTMATGGIFLAGGIPPKLLPLLRRPLFLESFLNKGRMRHLLETMPLHVVLNDETALLGAAYRAFQLAEHSTLPPL